MQKRNNETVEKLYQAILSLKDEKECRLFFEDICTIQELETIAQRLQVAELICEGRSYSEVNKITGASTTTICRVGKCVNYGEGGYRLALERIEGDKGNA